MKDKILYLMIGILIGGIIATSGFFIYQKTLDKNSNQPEMMQRNDDGQMQTPSNGNMGEPPEKPNGDNGREPMAKPGEQNNNTNM